MVAPTLADSLRGFVDADWYRGKYPDIAAANLDPLEHYVTFGAAEGRDPNRHFDTAWYAARYPDVAASGQNALLHYLLYGAAELRDPHPRFDAAYYVEQHPEAADNPLLYHIMHGAKRGWLTEKPLSIADYLPSTAEPPHCPRDLEVDVVVPVYRGLRETQRCLHALLDDAERPPGRIIVVDDHTPEAKLAAWLDRLHASGQIALVRNPRNLGFVASANRGISAAGSRDVALLNSDTEVPPGWLARLAAHAYASPRVASVSPFSNNATICGYPGNSGGPLALGCATAEIDAATRVVNAGRSVTVPTTVGFCMYIRRAALEDVGLFDIEAFGRGYGEETDFCLRAAARGWHHLLACDVFVYHKGAVSFRGEQTPGRRQGDAMLQRRYPNYERLVARHVNADPAGPARFALTAALFRASGRPTILLVSHELGGGVARHVASLVERVNERANFLLLQGAPHGVALVVPQLPDHSVLNLAAERVADLLRYLMSANVTRAHLHHLMGVGLDLRALIHDLGVGFDVTLHDYFAICPQVSLVRSLNQLYCGEPGPAGCNACIAARGSHGAREILSWRRGHAWQFLEAERVFCPSEDSRARLARYGLAHRAVVVPHEPVKGGKWQVATPKLGGARKLRIALLGVLAAHKGLLAAITAAEAADPGRFEFYLIGYPEQELPEAVARRITVTGEYDDDALPAVLAKVKPHVVWFPAQWPETYSYTLSAAIDAGLPIVAADIGAFPERLAGRPLTWLVPADASTERWLEAFGEVRDRLVRPTRALTATRPAQPDFYATSYGPPPTIRAAGPIDLRRAGRTAVVIIPERLGNGALSPCAYIRLLQPLDHPAIGGELDIVLADAEEALRYRADLIVTQRYAIADGGLADALAAHCVTQGARLVYDLDDDLLNIPRDHADAAVLRPRAGTVRRMLQHADAVWASTDTLAARLAAVRSDVRVIANGLDERLWGSKPPPRRPDDGIVRVLYMGTATHAADWALVEPALERLHDSFANHVVFDMLGVIDRAEVPPWVNRIGSTPNGQASYPGFVNWLGQHRAGWDIGIAPLVDTAFNACKSAIKTLDYAAMGLPVVASSGPAYRGSLADGPGGLLVPNTEAAWFAALARLVREPELRRNLAAGGYAAYLASGTLASQAVSRLAALRELAPRPQADGKAALRPVNAPRAGRRRTGRLAAE